MYSNSRIARSYGKSTLKILRALCTVFHMGILNYISTRKDSFLHILPELLLLFICLFTYLCVCAFVHVSVYSHVCVFACVCVCVCARARACSHARATEHTWRSEDIAKRLFLTSHHVRQNSGRQAWWQEHTPCESPCQLCFSWVLFPHM